MYCFRRMLLVGLAVAASLAMAGNLLSEKWLRTNQENSVAATMEPRNGDRFAPGSLPLSRLETYRKCYADPCRYKKQFRHRGDNIILVQSQDYKLVYFLMAKSASSTGRSLMQRYFNATEVRVNINDLDDSYETILGDYFCFTVFREPYSRFLAGFQQTLTISFHYLTVPPRHYQSFRAPFPNLTKWQHFAKSLSTEEGNRAAFSALQQFIAEYDAQRPIDAHLALQIPRLTNPRTGRTRPLDAAFDTASMHPEFQALAERVLAPPIQFLQAHKRRHSIDASGLTIPERRKICALSAIDYCCLNYPLPPECESVIQCQWTQKPDLFPGEWLIEPVSPYPPLWEDCEK